MNLKKLALTLVAGGAFALAQTPAPPTTPAQTPAQTGKKGSGKHHRKHHKKSKPAATAPQK